MSEKIEIDGIEIDMDKAYRIMNRIILEESRNVNSKKYNHSDMVKKIKKMIEEEIECY